MSRIMRTIYFLLHHSVCVRWSWLPYIRLLASSGESSQYFDLCRLQHLFSFCRVGIFEDGFLFLLLLCIFLLWTDVCRYLFRQLVWLRRLAIRCAFVTCSCTSLANSPWLDSTISIVWWFRTTSDLRRHSSHSSYTSPFLILYLPSDTGFSVLNVIDIFVFLAHPNSPNEAAGLV